MSIFFCLFPQWLSSPEKAIVHGEKLKEQMDALIDDALADTRRPPDHGSISPIKKGRAGTRPSPAER